MSTKRHWSASVALHVSYAAETHFVATIARSGHDGAIMPHGPAATRSPPGTPRPSSDQVPAPGFPVHGFRAPGFPAPGFPRTGVPP